TRLQGPSICLETTLHELLILGETFVFSLVDDGLRLRVGPHAMPGLDEEVEVGVVDVFTKRRIGEDVIDRAVWYVHRRSIHRGDRRTRAVWVIFAKDSHQ